MELHAVYGLLYVLGDFGNVVQKSTIKQKKYCFGRGYIGEINTKKYCCLGRG
jgi:hypothetical protein